MYRRHVLLIIVCLFLAVHSFTPQTGSQSTHHSLSLDGTDDYVSVPNSSSLDISGPITIEAWIKLNSATGSYQDIVCREAYGQAGTGGGYELGITNLGKIRLDLFQSHSAYTSVIGSTTVSANTWHHVAGVFDGSQLRVYLDGTLDGSVSNSSGPASGTSPLKIGNSTYANYYFGGLIDEVRVSAAALYSNNFTAGLGAGSNVRGYWKFDGQTPNDSSGNGNNGTLQGGATYSTDVPSVPNVAPAVSLTDPLNNTAFTPGATVVMDATASDSDGSINKVEFYQGSTLLGTDYSAPYMFLWNSVSAGSYSLTAKAFDELGASTNSTAVTIDVTSSSTHSLSLDGADDYLSVPNSSSIDISGPITIEAWIKLNSATGSYQDIVCRVAYGQAGTGGGYELGITNLGKIRLDLFQSPFAYTTVIGSSTVSANTWHHVAGVFDGSQIRVYLDGTLDGSVSSSSGPATGTSPLRIGNSTYANYYFGGLIDEVRVSAAALYSSNFTAGLGTGSNVRGYWKFDGQIPNDSSGNGNNGTLQNGATYSTTVPVPGPQRPVPNAGGPYSGSVSQSIQFSSSGSFDPDGTVASYRWNFGDGTTATSANPTHSYSASGTYTATLTVTDNSGLLSSATALVTISGSSLARLDPRNQTGGGGENPLSQNYNWILPILNLPGRAGLDLSLSLSYNSLVWTRDGSYISFDDDRGFPSAGFHLGFPSIQQMNFNSETGKWAYLLIGSSGSRTELRQVAVNSVYFESADSTHTLLDTSLLGDATNPRMLLRTADGTEMTYKHFTYSNSNHGPASGFECTEIKDRNGNYITIQHNSSGNIERIIDTLARQINFIYNSSTGLLESIEQTWTGQSQPHKWAQFTYENNTVNTNFQNLTKLGPANGSTVPALKRVTLPDSSKVEFDYTYWAQVWKINRYTSDGLIANYRAYNLPGEFTTPRTDCPRFTTRRDWAKNWNRSGAFDGPAKLPNGTEDEVLTGTWVPWEAASWNLPNESGGPNHHGVMVQVTAADGTYNKIFYEGVEGATSGWNRGLSSMVETWGATNPAQSSTAIKQRTSVTTWNQDNQSISYPLNPRVVETNVYDFDSSGVIQNRSRATVEFYPATSIGDGTSCRLPKNVIEYQADASTPMRRRYVEYELNSSYLARRIIGLPKRQELYGIDAGTETLLSKVDLEYDGTGSILGSDAPVQYDTSTPAVRGNVSKTTQHSVKPGETASISSRVYYNTTGSVVKTVDPMLHETEISYTDRFFKDGLTEDSTRPSTLAYPTVVTDPDDFTAEVRYNYDFGAVTWRRTPKPNVQTPSEAQNGPAVQFTFDEIGRLQKTKNLVNNASTRYLYNPNFVQTFSSVNSDAEIATEAQSITVFDGFGRTIATALKHSETTGSFAAQLTRYDKLGRVVQQSNPTETSFTVSTAALIPYSWAPVGDDIENVGFGWLYTSPTYDWKDRPLLTTNTDNTTTEAVYEGCGCAGGDVVTLTDEGTLDGGTAKRRKRIVSFDVLGREVKTQNFNWQTSNVYSTTITKYNARDQVTEIREFAGAGPTDPNDSSCPTGTCQKTTMDYDGHGRLNLRHVPQDSPGKNTTWTYNADNTVASLTDARDATSIFSYVGNNRRLVQSVTYSRVGSPSVPVSYTYDAVGNRTSMTDPLGATTYAYNQLSKLTSENRTTPSGSLSLSYQYNYSGQLSKITYPTNISIAYGYDEVGRVNSVTGVDTLYQNISQYASDFKYRAFGAEKEMKDGANRTRKYTYDPRLRAKTFEISGSVVNQSYDYYDDGALRFVENLTDNNFDRFYTYDTLGRMTFATTGGDARLDQGDVPYREIFAYTPWNDTASRFTDTWSGTEYTDAGTYTNRRRDDWSYETDGRIKTIGTREYMYDAAGNNTVVTGQRWTGSNYVAVTTTMSFDGDGKKVQEVSGWPTALTTTYLYSSVLGALVQETNSVGMTTRYVYLPDGKPLATLDGQASWKHETPLGTGQYTTYLSGFVGRKEFDPVQANVGLTAPAPPETHGGDGDLGSNHSGGPASSRASNMSNPAAGCFSLHGVDFPCGWSFFDVLTVMSVKNAGASAARDPNIAVWVPPKRLIPINIPNPFDEAAGMASVAFNAYIPGHWRYAAAPMTTIGLAQSAVATTAVGLNQKNPNDPCLNVNADMGHEDGQGYYRYSPRDPNYMSFGDPGLNSFAQAGVIAALVNFASQWHQLHPTHPIGVGELGKFGGGPDYGRHPGGGHAGGRIIDIRPMTISGGKGDLGKVSIGQPNYSRQLTDELVQGLFATGYVEKIIFNDTTIKGVTPDKNLKKPAHHNHLHVVFKSGICSN